MLKASDVTVVSAGQEIPNLGKRRAVATSKIAITFDNDANLKACVSALQVSDVALALKGDSMYVWELVTVTGNTIMFGVSWYDKEYFDAKRDAFTSKEHSRIFEQFGATADDFFVQHFVSIG